MSLIDSLKETVNNVVSTTTDGALLVDGEKAKQILPSDTTFALAAQMYLLPIEEGTLNAFKGNFESFWGYIAVSPSALRVFRDGNLAIEEQLTNVTAEYGIQADVKQVGINVGTTVGASYTKGGCVIKTTGYKIVPNIINPIVGQVPFASSVTGFNEGFDPLFNALKQGGATVNSPSTKSSIASIVIFAILFIGFIVAIAVFFR